MTGLDRSSFNTEPGLRSISFSTLAIQGPALFEDGPFFCVFYKLFLFVLGRMCYTRGVLSANVRGSWLKMDDMDRMCLA